MILGILLYELWFPSLYWLFIYASKYILIDHHYKAQSELTNLLINVIQCIPYGHSLCAALQKSRTVFHKFVKWINCGAWDKLRVVNLAFGAFHMSILCIQHISCLHYLVHYICHNNFCNSLSLGTGLTTGACCSGMCPNYIPIFPGNVATPHTFNI